MAPLGRRRLVTNCTTCGPSPSLPSSLPRAVPATFAGVVVPAPVLARVRSPRCRATAPAAWAQRELATRNAATLNAKRTARTAASLMIGVTLVGFMTVFAASAKTRELGLLRAVGMGRSQVRSTVHWESIIIAVFGTTLGLAIGTFFGWVIVRAMADEGIDTLTVPIGRPGSRHRHRRPRRGDGSGDARPSRSQARRTQSDRHGMTINQRRPSAMATLSSTPVLRLAAAEPLVRHGAGPPSSRVPCERTRVLHDAWWVRSTSGAWAHSLPTTWPRFELLIGCDQRGGR